MTIVDDLLEHPGVYIGLDRDPTDSRSSGAARIVVTPLPGRAGVSVDYEAFNQDHADRIRGHHEHTVIGRTYDGGAVMVVGHVHGESVAVLRETEPGTFEVGADGSDFPMKVVVSVPAPGRLVYSWWYAMPGEAPVERDVAEVDLQT